MASTLSSIAVTIQFTIKRVKRPVHVQCTSAYNILHEMEDSAYPMEGGIVSLLLSPTRMPGSFREISFEIKTSYFI